MNRITKYLRVYRMLLKCALMKQMEYRVNFLLMIGIEGIFLVTKLLYSYIVYDTGVTIHGFSPDMIIFYIGTFILMSGIYMFLFYFNFSNISSLEYLIVLAINITSQMYKITFVIYQYTLYFQFVNIKNNICYLILQLLYQKTYLKLI